MCKRLRLNVDQACGSNLDEVLDERRKIAAKSGRFEDRVALGALLADLGEFTDADDIYRQALRGYPDVSPFPVAWVCFQLGMLWGELASEPRFGRAEHWYRKAVACLPRYVKARVHLAEICSGHGRTGEAEAMLVPALASGDPEVRWRLADVLNAAGRIARRIRNWKPRDQGSRRFWRSTCWHSPIMARNSTPAVAAIPCGPCSSRGSTSTIARRCAPSNRHTQSPLRPARPTPPPASPETPSSVGANTAGSSCQLCSTPIANREGAAA